MSYHVLSNEADKIYINELCAASATSAPLENGSHGKPAPFWCACLSAARDQAGQATILFKEKKDRRAAYNTYKSLGAKLPKRCQFRRKDEQYIQVARKEKKLASCYIV